MNILDNLAQMEKLDKQGVVSSILHLPNQIEQAWEESSKIEFPPQYHHTKKVIIAGMGGSALGGRVVKALFSDKLRGPVEVCTEYKLPNYVGPDTLVILSSYSGNTEETLSAAEDALEAKASAVVIAAGGKLAELAKEKNLPSYIFVPHENPSNQPRMALGYSVVSIMAILSSCGFIPLTDQIVEEVIAFLKDLVIELGPRTPSVKNEAKTLAKHLKNKIPALISSEHLFGVAHAVKNQFNENAKTFTVSFDIPELNHHLMEGLKFPPEASGVLHFLFFESNLYSDKIQKRYSITMDVIAKNNHHYSAYNLKSENKITQAFEMLTFGSFVGFYLSMLYGIDPAPIPWVDYFKEKLK